MTLKEKGLSAFTWSFADVVAQQAVRFVISLILARLLMPSDFGLIAMVHVLLSFAEAIAQSGLGQALIQKSEVTEEDASSVFYFNIAFACALAGVFYLAAPAIAGFYGLPPLIPVTRLMAVGILINAFTYIHVALLQRELNIKTQLQARIISLVVSGGVGITMALNDFGVFSLVAQYLTANVMNNVLLWILHPWRPALVFSTASIKSLFSYGSKLLYSRVLDTFFNNLHIVVLGKIAGATDLGFFTRASQFQQFPARTIGGASGRVTFPLFSSLQSDTPRLRNAFRKAMLGLAMLTFPAMIGLAVTADTLVEVVLTEKWAPCVPYVRLLCIVGLLHPFHSINLNVLLALGRSDLFFRLEIVKKALGLMAVAFAFPFGIMGFVWSWIAGSSVSYFVNSYYVVRFLNYPLKQQLKDLLPYFNVAAIMGAVVHLIDRGPFERSAALLGAEIAAGCLLYVFLCKVFKLQAFQESYEYLRSRIGFASGRVRALRTDAVVADRN